MIGSSMGNGEGWRRGEVVGHVCELGEFARATVVIGRVREGSCGQSGRGWRDGWTERDECAGGQGEFEGGKFGMPGKMRGGIPVGVELKFRAG